MIGYDFDGVVSTGKFRVYPDDVIITGNTHHEGVMDKLQAMGIKARTYFPPDTRMSHLVQAIAVWKSEMIRRTGCEKFYEDDAIQATILKASCPDCEIICV